MQFVGSSGKRSISMFAPVVLTSSETRKLFKKLDKTSDHSYLLETILENTTVFLITAIDH